MPKDGIAWLCVVGKQGKAWAYLWPDADYHYRDKRLKMRGRYDPIVVDEKELLSKRYGHQN